MAVAPLSTVSLYCFISLQANNEGEESLGAKEIGQGSSGRDLMIVAPFHDVRGKGPLWGLPSSESLEFISLV